MPEVLIAPTGTANLASVQAAFRRLGAEPLLAEHADEIAAASHVMLPGVGAFGASMARLKERGLDAALRERILADRPTICICVGHQLLFAESEESPGVAGLGVIPERVACFPGGVRTPQFGWNVVRPAEDCDLLEEGYAYFANSYRATAAPGWKVAQAEHGGRFVAAVERGNVIGCQFHPELSGAYGAALLSRFLELG
jgi:imidazole glycerol phosphate synthase glutamine amidotransferase subunit